jgi:hypothetical protein
LCIFSSFIKTIPNFEGSGSIPGKGSYAEGNLFILDLFNNAFNSSNYTASNNEIIKAVCARYLAVRVNNLYVTVFYIYPYPNVLQLIINTANKAYGKDRTAAETDKRFDLP